MSTITESDVVRRCRRCNVTKSPAEFKKKNTCKRCCKDLQLRIHFRVTIDDAEELLASQNRRCAGCQYEFSEKLPWRVSFNYQTKKIRFIACSGCAIGAGVKAVAEELHARIIESRKAGATIEEICLRESGTATGVRKILKEKNPTSTSEKFDLTGRKFGMLEVLGRAIEWRARKNCRWQCKCDCGKLKNRSRLYLESGYSVSCGCVKSSVLRPSSRQVSTVAFAAGGLPETHWNYIKRNAEFRCLSFTVTAEEAWDIFEKQYFRCVFTGMLIKLPANSEARGRGEWTASFDRIDSKRGYEPGNVQWIHKRLQKMKHAMLDHEFIEWCRLIAIHRCGLVEPGLT